MRFLTRQHKTLISAIFLQAGIMAYLICEDRLMYGTNDDTTMVAIAAGGYGGTPSPYIVNIHMLIGYILKTLYTYLPAVNWMTVTYLVMYVLAFLVIDSILAGQCKNNSDTVITLCVNGITFYLMISFFSFTVVAYALLTAGIMSLWHKGIIPEAVICIMLASMMRSDVLNTAIVILFVYSLVYAICLDSICNITKQVMLIVGLAGMELISYFSNVWLLGLNDSEKAFLNWGEIRSRALDCTPVPYDKGLFDAHGFSKAAYDACYGAFYYIYDAVDTEKMRFLVDWNKNRYHFHVLGFIRAHFEAYTTLNYRGVWQGIFVAVIALNLIRNNRQGRIKALSLYVGVMTADYVYYFAGRPLLHVMMPTYVMGSLLGLLAFINSGPEQYENNNKRKRIASTALIGMLTMGFIIAIHYNPAKYSMVMTEDERNSLRVARQYIEDHQDRLFFALNPEVFALSVDEKMWKNRYKNNRYNLAGNWEIYSVPSDEMFDDYGIDGEKPGKAAMDSDNIVFLHPHPEDFDPDNNYVIDLYREQYHTIVRFELIDGLSNGWKTYVLRRTPFRETGNGL